MATELTAALKTLREFRGLDDSERDAFASLADFQDIEPGEIIIEQGEDPGGLMFIVSGSVGLYKRLPDGRARIIDRLFDGALIATKALFDEFESPHAVICGEEPVIVQVVPREDVRLLLIGWPELKERIDRSVHIETTADTLAAADTLREVPRDGLRALAESAEAIRVSANDPLYASGANDDCVYVVSSGQLQSYTDSQEAPLKDFGVGAIVGAEDVLDEAPASYNVVAVEDSIVFRVPGAGFREVIARQSQLRAQMQQMLGARPAVRGPEPIVEEEDDGTADFFADVFAADAEADVTGADASLVDDTPLGSDEPSQKAIKIGKKNRRKPPIIKQHSEMDCGAACLSMVCAFYGKQMSINKTREVARVRQDGASMANLNRAAKEFGFKTTQFVSTVEQLKEKTLPAIVNWRGYHWIVVYEVTDKEVIFADPAEGKVKMPIPEFEENWTRFTIFLEPTEKFDHIPEAKTTFRQFAKYVLPLKKYILEIFLASFFMQLLGVMTPLFSKFVIDEIILKADDQWLKSAVVVMIGVTLTGIVMNYIRDMMVLKVGFSMNMQIVTDVYERLMRLPLRYFESRRVGDVTNRLEQQEEVTEFITEDGLETILSLFTAVAYLVLMFYFHVGLTLAAISFLFLNLFLVRFISPRMRQLNRESFQKSAEQESHVIEAIGGAPSLKVAGASHMSRWRYEGLFAGVTNLQFKEAKYSQSAEIFSGMVDNLSDIAVLFMGGALVIQGELTIGDLVAFIAFANAVQGPINEMIKKWDDIQEVVVAIERMDDILKHPTEEDERPKIRDSRRETVLSGAVEFGNVTFRYEPDDPSNVLQGLTFAAMPGQRIAFVGPSGCGKSTLVKLLYGFYPSSSGQIRLDGFDINTLDLKSMRSQIAMVPQSANLFHGTIRENIAVARSDATLEEIVEAATLAGAHEFIVKMARGYDTAVEEGGSNMSGGQRQRIIIARAILQDAAVLILDEATSALDNESERVIMDNLKRRYEGKTILMIAHRLSTIRDADRIFCLNDGIVVEDGTHEELMDARGFYYYLNARQPGSIS